MKTEIIVQNIAQKYDFKKINFYLSKLNDLKVLVLDETIIVSIISEMLLVIG